MQRTWKLIVALGAGMAGFVSGLNAASAQDVAAPEGYQFFVTPYLWLASVHATTSTPLARRPEVNSNVSTVDLLSHLDGAPFMGSFEARYGALGFLADAIHLPVSTKITTRDIFFQGGNAELKADTGTGMALYRFFQDPVQFADGGLGFRAWGFSSNLTLNPGLLQGQTLNRTGSWADPLIGGRYHRELGNGWGLTAYGDVGGFGVGAHIDWQVLGTIDYTLSQSWNLHLGYRSLNFDITGSQGRFGFDVHMRGPILAGTFRF
ncbi:MAG: hypothetical protein JO320_15655 [Alphaproteobacteria bacterium]|nr:hypothetical protein [Alphaproteobacteria bacterium]